MKIGSFRPNSPFFLAPMAGMNDIAFRTLCKKAGAGLAYTGMISPLSRKKEDVSDNPAIQLFTNSGRGVSGFFERYDAPLFDFNLGCPAYIAKKQGFGAYLEDMKIIEKTLKAMKDSTDKPITLKIRKSRLAPKLLKLAERYCDAIGIHPRTRQQGYSDVPDIDFAREIKKKTSLPVIYSGDVNEENAPELLDEFDYLMVGRGALGDPGIFSRLNGKNTTLKFSDYIKLAKKHGLGTSQVKIHALYFTKGNDGAKQMRLDLARCKTIEKMEMLLNYR